MSDGLAPFRKYGQATCWGSRNLLNKKAPRPELIQRRRKRVRRQTCNADPRLSGTLNKIFFRRNIMAELLVKNAIEDHQVVSTAEWLAARKELLRKEKEFT